MKLVMNVSWNTVSLEEKHKLLYNNDENTILYNEYMMKLKLDLKNNKDKIKIRF